MAKFRVKTLRKIRPDGSRITQTIIDRQLSDWCNQGDDFESSSIAALAQSLAVRFGNDTIICISGISDVSLVPLVQNTSVPFGYYKGGKAIYEHD